MLDAQVNGTRRARSSASNSPTTARCLPSQNGARIATYRVPLDGVASADNLTPLAGSVSRAQRRPATSRSGSPAGRARQDGVEHAGAVDHRSRLRLPTMIESERDYTANSKVFQDRS